MKNYQKHCGSLQYLVPTPLTADLAA